MKFNITIIGLFYSLALSAQDSTKFNLDKLPEKFFLKVESTALKLDEKVTKSTEKYLRKLERAEIFVYFKITLALC